jgi:hypothetical protein
MRICISAYLGDNIIAKKSPKNQERIIRHNLKKMFLQVLMSLNSSDVVVVSMYDTCRERMKNYDKSHLVMIKTPTQITACLCEIVFWYVEIYVGIVRRSLISKKG